MRQLPSLDAMPLAGVVESCRSIDGLAVKRFEGDAATFVRTHDALEIVVRIASAEMFDGYKSREDRIFVARWTLPDPLDGCALAEWNAQAALAVGAAHSYDDLYGPSHATFFRAA